MTWSHKFIARRSPSCSNTTSARRNSRPSAALTAALVVDLVFLQPGKTDRERKFVGSSFEREQLMPRSALTANARVSFARRRRRASHRQMRPASRSSPARRSASMTRRQNDIGTHSFVSGCPATVMLRCRFTPESGHFIDKLCHRFAPRLRTLAVQKGMSALPPKADMCGALAHVRFVPIADIQLWQSLISACTRRFHFPHHLVEIEARWFLPRWEFLEALEPRCGECLQRHLNEGAICEPFVV